MQVQLDNAGTDLGGQAAAADIGGRAAALAVRLRGRVRDARQPLHQAQMLKDH